MVTVTDHGCPDPAKLTEYATSEITVAYGRALDRHLADCRACLDRFLELGRRSATPDIPDCHVVREVGRGRFGVVYKAWWTKGPPRLVALKVLTSPSEMERHRFEREIGVLKKLHSPGIVKCLESGMIGDEMYFVMDFVEGMHLDDYLSTAGLDLTGKLRVFERVCRAVAEAHAMGVIHRDLKPRNILVDDHGQPHILDFGICSVTREDWGTSTRATITHPGDVIGTLRYMSPEQAWGGAAGAVDQRSDLWSLGIMLHEIVTDGEYPYSLEPMPDKPIHEALLERIRKELPRLPKLSALRRGRDLEILLERCLAWEPQQRLSSVAVLADDIDRHITDHRIETNPLQIPYRVKRLLVGAATRSRWMLSLGLVATTALLVSLTAYLFRVGWMVTGREYHGSTGPVAAVSTTEDPRDEMMIVGISEESIEPVLRFASQSAFEGVTSDLRSWRAIHGHLMERLVAIAPRAIVWDYYFASPQPADAALVAGIEKLEAAGTPVVLASLDFRDDGAPVLSPGITEPLGSRLRFGAITASNMIERPGEFAIALKRSERAVIPSLALSTLAAVLHPPAFLEVDWIARERAIQLLYRIAPSAYLRERDRLEVTKVFQTGLDQVSARKGDLLACSKFELTHPDAWGERTVGYETLLTASEDELRTLLAGKIMVIGDLRRTPLGVPADRHRVAYGPTVIDDVPGCYLLGDAIVGLLERRYMIAAFPPPTSTYLILLVAATMGCWSPRRLASRSMFASEQSRRHLWIALLVGAVIGTGLMMLTTNRLLVHAGMVGIALALPMAGSFWVEFARNRHRIIESDKRPVDSFLLADEGTLTMPPKRPTWLPRAKS